MLKNIIPVLGIAALSLYSFKAEAQDTPAKSTNSATAGTNSAEAKPAPKKKQSELASKTATFGSVAKTDDSYQTALDAHALDKALKEANKPGAFKGTVSAVFEPRGGGMAILNFDENYRTALTALLHGNDFTNFPDLKKIVGKEVLVSGKFISYQGRAEIVLTNTAQVKVVGETAK